MSPPSAEPHVMNPYPPAPFLLVLGFANGCASLIYVVVWIQLVEPVLGESAASMTGASPEELIQMSRTQSQDLHRTKGVRSRQEKAGLNKTADYRIGEPRGAARRYWAGQGAS